MWNWIDRIPLVLLIAVALLLAIAPIQGTPHLLEKLGMLMQGTLVRPIDIFDLFLHATPLVLVVIRIMRMVTSK